MPEQIIDLRSDTITKPTPGMRRAIAEAVVGDDVFGEDPTVRQLEQRAAELLGKEAALFVASGTMSNQIAVRCQTSPGDEVICEGQCHIYWYEQAGYAQLSGVSMMPVPGDFGILRPEQLARCIRRDDPHFPRTRMLCLENTHNRGAGRIQPYENVQQLCRWAHDHQLVTHLDGARLMNAVVATGIPARDWAAHFDTVSMCFSKGLGAPVGSVLAGSRNCIDRAVRHRKLLGGGMRQAGIIAAAALYALDHHVDRLAEDHAAAQRLAEAIAATDGLRLSPEVVDTNIVCFQVDSDWGTAAEFNATLAQHGLRLLDVGPQRLRAVTHLDVNEGAITRAAEILAEVVAGEKTASTTGHSYA